MGGNRNGLLTGKKIAVVGGCGHVGLPLGVKFAEHGAQTVLIDIDANAVQKVNSGQFPFLEKGGDEQLKSALKSGLTATTDQSSCKDANVVVFVVGTPVDEHLNPKLSGVLKIFDHYQQYFSPGTLIVMRSTLFPGTMEYLYNKIVNSGLDIRLAFCPERVAQGFALDEIDSLPQVVSTFDEKSFELAYDVFSALAPSIIRLTPLEAEITKLMANAWRYLEFAIANQFYMIAEKNGVDFFRIFQAVRYDYPRAKGYKSPGFAAGPCLFKDTMQLASYYDNQFHLGHTAMLVNEGLATFVVEKTQALVQSGQPGESNGLWGKTIGLLGMTFKADNDDIRESLSFKVKKGLEFLGAQVLCHDPYLNDSTPLDQLLTRSDAIVLCTTHSEYRNISIKKPLVDIWGFFAQPKIEVLPGRQSGQSDKNAEKKVVHLR